MARDRPADITGEKQIAILVTGVQADIQALRQGKSVPDTAALCYY